MKKNYHRQLPVTFTEHRWGVYITEIGYFRGKEGSPLLCREEGRDSKDFYLVLILDGKGSAYCHFMYPGATHRYDPDVSHIREEYWVGFNGYFAGQLMQRIFSPSHPVIRVGDDQEIRQLFDQMAEEVHLSSMGYAQTTAGLLVQLLARVHAMAQLAGGQRHAP